MGAKNRFGFTVVHEPGLVNGVRLQVCASGDGSFPGDTGPYHRWVDVHSHKDPEGVWVLDDVPITEDDGRAVRCIQRLALMRAEYGFSVDLVGRTMTAIATAAWSADIADRIAWVMFNGSEDPAVWTEAADALLSVERWKANAAGVTL